MHLANLAQRGEIRIPSLTKLKLFLMFFVLRTSTDNVLPMTPATATADSTTPSHQYANTLTGYHMLIFLWRLSKIECTDSVGLVWPDHKSSFLFFTLFYCCINQSIYFQRHIRKKIEIDCCEIKPVHNLCGAHFDHKGWIPNSEFFPMTCETHMRSSHVKPWESCKQSSGISTTLKVTSWMMKGMAIRLEWCNNDSLPACQYLLAICARGKIVPILELRSEWSLCLSPRLRPAAPAPVSIVLLYTAPWYHSEVQPIWLSACCDISSLHVSFRMSPLWMGVGHEVSNQASSIAVHKMQHEQVSASSHEDLLRLLGVLWAFERRLQAGPVVEA